MKSRPILMLLEATDSPRNFRTRSSANQRIQTISGPAIFFVPDRTVFCLKSRQRLTLLKRSAPQVAQPRSFYGITLGIFREKLKRRLALRFSGSELRAPGSRFSGQK